MSYLLNYIYRRSFTILKLFFFLYIFKKKISGLHITSQSFKLGVTLRDKVGEST